MLGLWRELEERASASVVYRSSELGGRSARDDETSLVMATC